MAALHQFLASQLANPRGLFGRQIMAGLLNRGNAELIATTLASLELSSGQHYLDAGFGGGHSLRIAAGMTGDAPLYGIDVSPDMVVRGQRKMRALIAAGRLHLIVADLADIPLQDARVDKISSINTIYFWQKPEAAMASFYRLLRPGGSLAIGFTGAAKMLDFSKVTRHGFTSYTPEPVAKLMEDAGFTSVTVQPAGGRRTRGDYVALGYRD